MKLFDIVCIDKIDKTVTERLGFNKIYTSKDILLLEKTKQNSVLKYILISSDENEIKKAIRDEKCIGILFKENILMKKILEQLSSSEKLIFINISLLTNNRRSELPRNLSKIRTLLKNSKIYGLNTKFATFAKENYELISSSQFLSIVSFVCDEIKLTKTVLSNEKRFYI
ncbi:MAG: hypothetical protein ACP5M9_03450 [Candidatus Micrarchaeia archaeon]